MLNKVIIIVAIMEEKGMHVPSDKWKVADKKLVKDYLKHRRKYETVN